MVKKLRSDAIERERFEREKLAAQWAKLDQNLSFDFTPEDEKSAVEKLADASFKFDPNNPGPMGVSAFTSRCDILTHTSATLWQYFSNTLATHLPTHPLNTSSEHTTYQYILSIQPINTPSHPPSRPPSQSPPLPPPPSPSPGQWLLPSFEKWSSGHSTSLSGIPSSLRS